MLMENVFPPNLGKLHQ